MEKKQTPDNSSKTKPQPQPVRMIPQLAMTSSVSQTTPHMMHEFIPLTQQIPFVDLATLSTTLSQQIPLADLTTLSTTVSQEDLGTGNIPLLEVLTDSHPPTPKPQAEHTSHEARETTPPQEDEQSCMSEEEMDQTILDILKGENAGSPASNTPDTISVTQLSPLSQSQSSGQSSSLVFIPRQDSPRQDSPITAGPSVCQQLLPVGQGYQVSEFPSPFGCQMPILGGQGPHHISGSAPYPGSRVDNSEMLRFPVFEGYAQGRSPTPLPPQGMMDYRQEAGSTSQEGQPRLWKFVLDLLEDPRYNPSLITWVSRPEGIFRLMDPPRLAEFWGHVKGNKSMNYEKLSRGLRYYYNGQVLEHVPGKLVYKFGPTAQVWPYLAQTNQPRPATTPTSTVTSQYQPHTSH